MNVQLGNVKGFTLIEIIAVMIILGMLAAVAVPKFITIQEQAKKSTLQLAVGAVVSQASLAYTKALLAESGDSSLAWGRLVSNGANEICNKVLINEYKGTLTWQCEIDNISFDVLITDISASPDVTVSGKYLRP